MFAHAGERGRAWRDRETATQDVKVRDRRRDSSLTRNRDPPFVFGGGKPPAYEKAQESHQEDPAAKGTTGKRCEKAGQTDNEAGSCCDSRRSPRQTETRRSHPEGQDAYQGFATHPEEEPSLEAESICEEWNCRQECRQGIPAQEKTKPHTRAACSTRRRDEGQVGCQKGCRCLVQRVRQFDLLEEVRAPHDGSFFPSEDGADKATAPLDIPLQFEGFADLWQEQFLAGSAGGTEPGFSIQLDRRESVVMDTDDLCDADQIRGA